MSVKNPISRKNTNNRNNNKIKKYGECGRMKI